MSQIETELLGSTLELASSIEKRLSIKFNLKVRQTDTTQLRYLEEDARKMVECYFQGQQLMKAISERSLQEVYVIGSEYVS